MWFAEQTGNKIGRITTGGVTTEYPVPTDTAGPFGIAAGFDGALWFSETAANKIGRITVPTSAQSQSPPSAAPTTSPPGLTGPGSDRLAPALHIKSISRHTGRAGTLTIRVSCPRGELFCAGLARLSSGSRRLGTKAFSVAGGRSKTVRLRISKSGRRLLRTRRRLSSTLRIRVNDAAGNAKTLRRTISLRR
jgi:hypothetical protein